MDRLGVLPGIPSTKTLAWRRFDLGGWVEGIAMTVGTEERHRNLRWTLHGFTTLQVARPQT